MPSSMFQEMGQGTHAALGNVALVDMVAEGWDPDVWPWHLQCSDGEYWVVPTSFAWSTTDIAGFTRIATSQAIEAPSNGLVYWDVFQRA